MLSRGISDKTGPIRNQPPAQTAGGQQVEQGQWTADYGRQIEQSLGAEEAGNLNKVADKMLEQQAAAQMRATPIRVTVPQQGLHLPFRRDLQIQAAAAMDVQFKAGSGRLLGVLSTAGSALLLAALFWFALRLFAPRGTEF